MFDTHCHLDDPVFDQDREAVWHRAAEAGVTDVLLAGVRPSLFPRLWETAERARGVKVHVSQGVHPQVVLDLEEAERRLFERLEEALGAPQRPLAIGECGFDKNIPERDTQERWFRAQIRAARALKLPLLLHVYGAHEHALRVLREEHAVEVGGIAHSYSGSAELVPRYIELGFGISFAGPITWKRSRKPVLAAQAVPDDWLLAETDAPDQSPEGWRGQRNEPAQVAAVIAGLAEARKQSLEHVKTLTVANARRILGLR